MLRDILDRLPLQGVHHEADEVDRMFRLEGLTDLAHRLESPDAWTLAIIQLASRPRWSTWSPPRTVTST